MREAAAELRRGALQGANITMPYKNLAADLSDQLVGPARRSGSVNTWVMERDRLMGYSTDGAGLRFAWDLGGLPTDGPILVLGNGGAAAAALLEFEAHRLLVSARRSDALPPLIERLGLQAEQVEWGISVPGATVVNATPLGMHGEALPEGIVESASGFVDMSYGGERTPAVETAVRLGIPHAEGLDMLVGQAMASFALWTGVDAAEGVMRAAVV